MMQQYMEELELEPFDANDFVERLTWRANNEVGSSQFDPEILHETFVNTIKDLKILQEKQQRKCERIEESLKEEQKVHARSVSKLQERHQTSVEWFHQLDEKINSVAGKIIHLGEQLENVNTPRSRTVEAQKLLNHMSEFLMPGPIVNDLFTDPSRLYEAADVIQKLYTISQDLPASKFEEAKRKIERKYDEIERGLIEEFATAQKAKDIEKMKKIAIILLNFKGYSQCINAYIEQSQMTQYGGKDIFFGIVPMCEEHNEIIKKVFLSPDQVMAKFILNIYQLKLNEYARMKLEDKKDDEKYLKTLHEMYSRTVKLSTDLQKYMPSSDDDLLTKLTANIFAKDIAIYLETETRCLKNKCTNELEKYYNSKKHQKKQTERFQDLKREVQASLSNRLNINIAQVEDYGGETFLSEELAINLLQQTKTSLKRCRILSKENDLAGNVIKIADILLLYLMHEHVNYALELGLQAIPLGESKVFPQIYFFDVIQKSNTIVHLLENLYTASIVPCVKNTTKLADCLQKKRLMLEQIENKLDTGLDRVLNSIIGWVKIYLQTEQKKTDYKPENDVDTLSSQVCLHVVQTLQPAVKQIKKCLDGENLQTVLTEFGIRLHRVIYEHLQSLQFNIVGAMCVICDVNEYRKLARELNSSLVTQLFDTLHALCNLLLVKPENILEACTGDTLNNLDKSVIRQFIQLRGDFRAIKTANYLKGIIE
ncbi:exocyst complex component 5 [Condylostylus longicornis]|uniref:exocyst complex component 5 n=1 Tax=Condylostylus longicornis TaxID=2530218 RepID=UPI00244DFDA8|nr:exocyst complex component 5 [Condylostylus longicornis]